MKVPAFANSRAFSAVGQRMAAQRLGLSVAAARCADGYAWIFCWGADWHLILIPGCLQCVGVLLKIKNLPGFQTDFVNGLAYRLAWPTACGIDMVAFEPSAALPITLSKQSFPPC